METLPASGQSPEEETMTGGVNLRAIYLTGIAGNLVQLAIVPDDVKKAKRLLE